MERTEWLKWRRKGMGSSDAPIIMGVSKFSTAMSLWEEKISEDEPEESTNFIMELGNEAEPRIRSLFGFIGGEDFLPALFEMDGFNFVRASLDGINFDKTKIIEIKLAGKEVYEMAKAGAVHPMYLPQVQHQLMVVPSATVCSFIVYPMDEFRKDRSAPLNADLLACVEVKSDKDYQGILLETELKFWDCVTTKKQPMASNKDYKSLSGQAKLLTKWKKLKVKADKVETELEEARQAVIAEAKKQGHYRYLSSGVRIAESARMGNVDYKKIPELKGVDLDKYRGKGTTSWRGGLVED